MACDDESCMSIHSSSIMQLEDEEYDDIDIGNDGYGHHPHPHLSRLSMCSGNDEDNNMRMYMSRLSIESWEGDADEEYSDEKGGAKGGLLSSDSEKEPVCYSLPATPPRRRTRGGLVLNQQQQQQQQQQQPTMMGVMKEYASENEAQQGRVLMRKNLRRRRRMIRERRWDDYINNNRKEGGEVEMMMEVGNGFSSGESEGSGVVVITRPKGGRRSLCMDLEEVKACKDLGFELEHECMLEIPTRLSIPASPGLDTSSGGNSPISTWRISSPGDDPRDVKARLKVWAQAVALASASRPGSCN